MARDFPEIREGDEVKAWWFNAIYAELRRWRGLHGSGYLHVDHADSVHEPPAIVDYRPDRRLVPVLLPSGIGAGSYSSPSSTTGTLLQLLTPGPGFTTTDAPTESVYYTMTQPVTGTNKFGWATRQADGRLYLVAADC